MDIVRVGWNRQRTINACAGNSDSRLRIPNLKDSVTAVCITRANNESQIAIGFLMEFFMEITLTKENFEQEVLKSELPVLVDFWAPWCGPCRMLAPTVEEIAKEYDGKIKVGKVNVDDESELAKQFGIMSIPTVILFKNGQEAKKSIGLVEKEELVEMFS